MSVTSPPQYVPGRPMTGPEESCPFCLKNNALRGDVFIETSYSYVVLVSEDLLLICPKEHVTENLSRTGFAAEYFELLELALVTVNWKSWNDSRNHGDDAGQRLQHIHYKVRRRDPGLNSSGLGLDGLIAKVDGKM
jgi:hypothetical protein